ncbi:MAG TPA: hypothetical protein VIJ67_04725 [Pseudolabrys sp.]
MTDLEPPEPFLLRVNVEPTPSLNDPRGVDEFYKALGILMIAWGRLEGHFVVCLLTILAAPGGHLLGRNVPLQWSERAKMWRKAFDTLAPLQGMRPSASEFLTEIEDLAVDRNAIVHALWEPFDPGHPPSVGIVSIKKKIGVVDGLDIKRASITLATIRNIGSRMNELNLRLMDFSRFLTDWRRKEAPPFVNIRVV